MNTASQMLPFIRRIAMILIILIALVNLLGQFTDVSALLATLGVGSLAIALAAQTSLEDLFSGFIIKGFPPDTEEKHSVRYFC